MKKRLPGKVIMERKAMFVSKISRKDSKVVLKVHFGNDPVKKNMLYREKVALEVLKGLAVPKRVFVSHDEVRKLVKEKQFSHIAMEWVSGKGCFGRKFSSSLSVALWAFTIEQLCAFRRRNILYTDLKHNHLRVSDDVNSAYLIDFDGCVLVEPSGIYPTYALSNTPELSPPEFNFVNTLTERYVVYQIGMLLGSFLLQYFHNNHINTTNFKRIKKKLKKSHMGEVFDLFASCIAKSPSQRPKNLEALFGRLEKIHLSEKSYLYWNKLREPFEKDLNQLGFHDISNSKIPQLKVA
jgi:hypothetical protein